MELMEVVLKILEIQTVGDSSENCTEESPSKWTRKWKMKKQKKIFSCKRCQIFEILVWKYRFSTTLNLLQAISRGYLLSSRFSPSKWHFFKNRKFQSAISPVIFIWSNWDFRFCNQRCQSYHPSTKTRFRKSQFFGSKMSKGLDPPKMTYLPFSMDLRMFYYYFWIYSAK